MFRLFWFQKGPPPKPRPLEVFLVLTEDTPFCRVCVSLTSVSVDILVRLVYSWNHMTLMENKIS